MAYVSVEAAGGFREVACARLSVCVRVKRVRGKPPVGVVARRTGAVTTVFWRARYCFRRFARSGRPPPKPPGCRHTYLDATVGDGIGNRQHFCRPPAAGRTRKTHTRTTAECRRLVVVVVNLPKTKTKVRAHTNAHRKKKQKRTTRNSPTPLGANA